MLEKIIELDKALLLLLNGWHTEWLDPIMIMATKTIVWLPLYLILLFLVIRKFKKDTWIVLIGITIAILFSDQITSGFMKPFFERLRPSHTPELIGQLHLVDDYKGGLYGFASSHAANTFATAIFFFLALPTYRYTWLLFIWAAFMTYTRIYLGVHYPSNILAGAIIGLGSGWIGFKLQSVIENQIDKFRKERK